jgi:hypothetical protein
MYQYFTHFCAFSRYVLQIFDSPPSGDAFKGPCSPRYPVSNSPRWTRIVLIYLLQSPHLGTPAHCLLPLPSHPQLQGKDEISIPANDAFEVAFAHPPMSAVQHLRGRRKHKARYSREGSSLRRERWCGPADLLRFGASQLRCHCCVSRPVKVGSIPSVGGLRHGGCRCESAGDSGSCFDWAAALGYMCGYDCLPYVQVGGGQHSAGERR